MNLVVAVNNDWGIGYNNTQSIVIPEDRQHLQKITKGGTIIVGRKTFEDFGRPLPNRKNIVMTRDRNFMAGSVIVAHSVDEVLAKIADESTDNVFVLGGESIYNLFLPMCSYAYITKVEASPLSDTFFPNLDESPDWSLDDHGETRESKGIRYSFNKYSKKTAHR